MRTSCAVVLAVWCVAGGVALAQSGTPRNDLPQPYRTTRDWGQLPAGVKWAAVTAIEPEEFARVAAEVRAEVRSAIVGRDCHIGEKAVVSSGAVLGDGTILTAYSKT